MTTAMGPNGINIDFLRSGKQFVRNVAANAQPTGNSSSHGRLEEFYAKTLEAFLTSTQSQHQQPPPQGININLLRSGRQFVTPKESVPSIARKTGRKSANSRLEEFHTKMLQAYQAQKAVNKTNPDGQGAATINVAALRSGRQFVTPPESAFTPSPTTGRHTRLESFYNKTLQSHKAQPPNGINVDVLRSGRQFVTPPESAFTPSETRGRHTQLKSFYAKGLAAVKSSASPSSTTAPRPINLDFIRSGQEFQGATAQSPEAKRWDRFKTKGRHARLECFHDSMLKAFAKSITPTVLSAKDPTESNLTTDKAQGINLDFIRSGQEFSGATAASPESRRWDRFKASGRQNRLERFHEKTLQAHSLTARTM